MKSFWKKLFGWLEKTAEPVATQHVKDKLEEVAEKNTRKPRDQRYREAQREGGGE